MIGGENSGIALQPRDIAVLRGLVESRVLTLSHISKLYFDGKFDAAKKRVYKLKVAGLMAERPRRIGEPSILFLSRAGFNALIDGGNLDGLPDLRVSQFHKRVQVSPLTLRHELDVMDVIAAIFEGVRCTGGLQFLEFSTWPRLYQFKVRSSRGEQTLVKPDGFIRVQENASTGLKSHTFYVEVDRSTEAQSILAAKAAWYVSFYRSGGLALRYGYSATAWKRFPFRVLMIFQNAERRNNAARTMLGLARPMLSQVWLSTMKETISNPLGPIWVRPRDYRDIAHGTDVDQVRGGGLQPYRRNPQYERFIETNLTKQTLFAAACQPENGVVNNLSASFSQTQSG